MEIIYLHRYINNAKSEDHSLSINIFICYILNLSYSKTAPSPPVSACLKHRNIDYHNCILGR